MENLGVFGDCETNSHKDISEMHSDSSLTSYASSMGSNFGFEMGSESDGIESII